MATQTTALLFDSRAAVIATTVLLFDVSQGMSIVISLPFDVAYTAESLTPNPIRRHSEVNPVV